MDATPAVIRITDLHRNTTEVVNETIHSGRPVFVTQYGYVTAVLLSREQYDDLSHARRRENESDRSVSRSGVARSLAPREPRRVVVPLHERLIRTQYGHCDYETARFLAEEGALTELVETEDGWVLDEGGGALGPALGAEGSAE